MTQFEKHQYWTAIVNQQQGSGISIPQFCKQNDINYAKFHYWMKKIEHTDNEQIVQPKKKSGRIEKAINFIAKLYGIEQEAKGLSAVERHQLRQQKSKPILDKFYEWLLETQDKILPKSQLGCAVNYAINQ